MGQTAEMGTSYINRSQDGIPVSEEKYVVETRFVIFETDIPAQHHRAAAGRHHGRHDGYDCRFHTAPEHHVEHSFGEFRHLGGDDG